MPIDLKLSGVEAAGKPLPEGEYLFLLEDAELKPAKGGGSTNLVMKLTVQEPEEYNGRKQTETINIQESTYPFVKRFLNELYGYDVGDMTLDESELPGNSIIGVIRHTEDNGVTYGNVIAWKHFEG